MIRQIIEIDEEKCNGCGLCIPECKEGAIQIINGKAKLISDLICDGLGACIGYCPEGAIEIVEKEAEPYNEKLVLDKIMHDPDVLWAHLKHLSEHNDEDNLNVALEYLLEKKITIPKLNGNTKKQYVGDNIPIMNHSGGCPGSRVVSYEEKEQDIDTNQNKDMQSELNQWPIQLHLVPPTAPFFRNKELVILSSCGPVASANVHRDYLKGKAVVIACPKLDYTEPYREKLAAIIAENRIKDATVVIMEVPCCKGLTKMATDAAVISGSKIINIKEDVLTLDGKLKSSGLVYNPV